MAHQQLRDAVRSSDFGNQLHNFWVVVPPIAANDQKGPFSTFWNGEENACDKGFGVIGPLEDRDSLAKSRSRGCISRCRQWVICPLS